MTSCSKNISYSSSYSVGRCFQIWIRPVLSTPCVIFFPTPPSFSFSYLSPQILKIFFLVHDFFDFSDFALSVDDRRAVTISGEDRWLFVLLVVAVLAPIVTLPWKTLAILESRLCQVTVTKRFLVNRALRFASTKSSRGAEKDSSGLPSYN